jgi:hypothetical protein
MPRTKITIAVAAAVLAMAGRAAAQEPGWGDERGYDDTGYGAPNQDAMSVQTFQAPLAPYGQWVVSPTYGQVWRPNTAPGWRPYYYGRWEWTDEGWLWVSDEPFGWAVYHYGRWAWDAGWGWIWVPGYQWAPAWVSWRYSGEVIGWAPLAPGFSVYVTSYPFYDYWWTFVPCVRFVGMPVYRIAYAPTFTRRWYDGTTPAPAPRARPAPTPTRGPTPTPAWGGPTPRFVSERSGRQITPVRIAPAAAPGAVASREGVIPVYRPELAPMGRGRGPGAVAPPGQVRGGERPYPQFREHGRGTAPVPAPGWGGERGQDGGGNEPVQGGSRAQPRPVAPAPAPANAPRGGGERSGNGSAHGGGRSGNGSAHGHRGHAH